MSCCRAPAPPLSARGSSPTPEASSLALAPLELLGRRGLGAWEACGRGPTRRWRAGRPRRADLIPAPKPQPQPARGAEPAMAPEKHNRVGANNTPTAEIRGTRPHSTPQRHWPTQRTGPRATAAAPAGHGAWILERGGAVVSRAARRTQTGPECPFDGVRVPSRRPQSALSTTLECTFDGVRVPFRRGQSALSTGSECPFDAVTGPRRDGRGT